MSCKKTLKTVDGVRGESRVGKKHTKETKEKHRGRRERKGKGRDVPVLAVETSLTTEAAAFLLMSHE